MTFTHTGNIYAFTIPPFASLGPYLVQGLEVILRLAHYSASCSCGAGLPLYLRALLL